MMYGLRLSRSEVSSYPSFGTLMLRDADIPKVTDEAQTDLSRSTRSNEFTSVQGTSVSSRERMPLEHQAGSANGAKSEIDRDTQRQVHENIADQSNVVSPAPPDDPAHSSALGTPLLDSSMVVQSPDSYDNLLTPHPRIRQDLLDRSRELYINTQINHHLLSLPPSLRRC